MKNKNKKPRVLALMSALVLALVISCVTFRGQQAEPINVAQALEINNASPASYNILEYPYYSSNITSGNFTVKINPDYSITFNGTASSTITFLMLYRDSIDLSAYTSYSGLTLSLNPQSGTESGGLFAQFVMNSSWASRANKSNNYTMYKSFGNNTTLTQAVIYVESGTTCDNFTIKPMLNLTNSVSDWTAPNSFNTYYNYENGYNVGLDFNLYDVFGGATFNAVVSPIPGNPTSGGYYTYNNLTPNYYSTPGIGFSSFYEDYISSNSYVIANNGADYQLTLDITFAKPFDYLNTAPFAIRSPYEYSVNDHSVSEQYITIMNRGGFTLQADYNQTQEFSTPFTYRGYFADVTNVDSLRIRIENPYKYLKDFYLIRQNANDTLVYDKGFQDGYDQGYTNGSGAGYDQGLEQGLEQGLSDGYSNGYSQGYDDAQEGAYDLGYDEGRSDGYRVGYDDGYSVGFGQNNTFAGLFYSAVNAPLQVFTEMFNFDFLGINLTSFFLSCLGIAIIIVVIRWFL